jgi:hypothetical protein
VAISLEDARRIADALARHLRDRALDGITADDVARLRAANISEPVETADGIAIPPWHINAGDNEHVELTWTIDLGHESGVRRWFVARVTRDGDEWAVRSVSAAYARRAR